MFWDDSWNCFGIIEIKKCSSLKVRIISRKELGILQAVLVISPNLW